MVINPSMLKQIQNLDEFVCSEPGNNDDQNFPGDFFFLRVTCLKSYLGRLVAVVLRIVKCRAPKASRLFSFKSCSSGPE